MMEKEFIFDSAPFAQCHASTLVQDSQGGLVASWFGGTREGAQDVGIWISREVNGEWMSPVEAVSEECVPCWNPVLFLAPDERMWLFYKVGESPRSWSGGFVFSDDDGRSWSEPTLLPAGILGPIKNKPILMSNGEILCPTSVEAYRAWTGWVEKMSLDGSCWERYGPITYPGVNRGLIQPTVVELETGRVTAFLRSTKEIGSICIADSDDYGETWSEARKTELPNPNSGIDAVKLNDGCVVMVYNHSRDSRYPLNVGLSDDGDCWRVRKVLEDEPGEYSYPAVIQTTDGLIHTVYTYKREKIRHCVFDLGWLES